MIPPCDDHELIVVAVLRRGDKVLLCHRRPDRRNHPNSWGLPGGHVEPGETPSDALRRELLEEVGVVLQGPIGPPMHSQRLAMNSAEMMVWLIDHEREVSNRAPDEHDELRWCSADEIGQLDLAHDWHLSLLRDCL